MFYIMHPCRDNARNVNSRNKNATPLVQDQEVFNAEFRNAMRMLDHSMTNQNNRVHAPLNVYGGSTTTIRVRDFDRMNTLEFLGSHTNEDPQNFLNEDQENL